MDASMDDFAKTFIWFDYSEAKDLAKAFLTLVSAVLVLSLTFSEKVIGVTKAPAKSKFLVLSSWISFIITIVLCGGSLVLMYGAGMMAAHQYSFLRFFMFLDIDNYMIMAGLSQFFLFFAGVFFILALALLVFATAVAMYAQPITIAPDRS